jgi:uncharacterized membrane protein
VCVDITNWKAARQVFLSWRFISVVLMSAIPSAFHQGIQSYTTLLVREYHEPFSLQAQPSERIADNIAKLLGVCFYQSVQCLIKNVVVVVIWSDMCNLY